MNRQINLKGSPEHSRNEAGSIGFAKVGIIGGAGYTGGELIRILLNHPQAEIFFVHSNSNAGRHIHEVHADLLGETSLKFSELTLPLQDNAGDIGEADVIFLCVGHNEAKKFLEENSIPDHIKVIDLSQDFRLYPKAQSGRRKFVYGLPEMNRDEIKAAQNIANPGCFATAIQLGLLPLANACILKEVYTSGITGSTGAGQSLSPTSHFSWRTNNIQPYKTLRHQHLHEIYQSLHQLQNNFPLTSPEEREKSNNAKAEEGDVHFVPWRGDFARGIFITSQLRCKPDEKEIISLYEEFYKDHPFTFISHDAISLKQVVNTNKCVIQVEKVDDTLVVHSAIDNLLKGASGQAVQNMNLMFGFPETTGLKFKATGF